MENASFKLANYKITQVNLNLDLYNNSELNLSFDLSGIYNEEKNNYTIIFDCQVKNEHETTPFLTVKCKGVFDFENVSSFEEIPTFFFKNALAILFPYLRAYISLITTQSQSLSIILPTLNLSSFEQKLRDSTQFI